MSNILLDINNLSTSFYINKKEIKAINGISFHINKNEIYALVGESGAGKSTVAHSIMKLLPNYTKYSGDIYFKGFRLNSTLGENLIRSIRGNSISIIFQEPMTSLNPLHTIQKQISEMLYTHQKEENFSSKQIHNKIIKLLKQVQLSNAEEFLLKYPHQLSGGQRQRIMIAMALANKPDLLIADEPTTALDVTIQLEILKLLKQLKSQLNMSLLLITHDLLLVRKIADIVAVMRFGKIVEQNTNKEIFNNPQHEYTRYLLESEPKMRIQSVSKQAHTIIKTDKLKVFYPIYKGIFRKVKDYVKAVNGITIHIREGETVGLVGESGSGKTSFGLALLRLIKSDGAIEFNSIPLQNLKSKELQKYRKKIQVVFQDPFASLNPKLSIRQIIEEGLLAHNVGQDKKNPSEYRKELIINALEDVSLHSDLMNRYPHEFSGGQRQRICIARAIVLRPKFLILDEPTSALDQTVQSQLIDLLLYLQNEYKIAYLFISHDLRVVHAMSHYIAVIKNGSVIEEGLTKQIFENPKEEYTKTLINSAFYSSL